MPWIRLSWLLLTASAICGAAASRLPRIIVSPNHRYLQTSDGEPFFWLADTGWLLFQKLDRAATERYLDNRRELGFNVIQAMVLHTADDRNVYGASALNDGDPARPCLTNDEHDYWKHIDWVLDAAAARGIYVAMVPSWGALAARRALRAENVEAYARFLAERYRDRPNIFWMTGGDIRADRHLEIWRAMGRTLRAADPGHLITYHPFGRTSSSEWFHAEPWLDFNMFQSGHRSYAQEKSNPGSKGEDNWRYVQEDYARTPPKPTIDGEPSYEGIPHGLHDTSQPYWKADDSRRYAYWSVFAGAFGHTYGNNAVMQMNAPDSRQRSFGPKNYWYEAIHDPGAAQMRYLKKLILSRPYFERVPAQELVAGGAGTQYDRILATRGRGFAMFYTYSGRAFQVRMGATPGKAVRVSWYNPRTGAITRGGTAPNSGVKRFVPPGTPGPGNDWVLLLDEEAERHGRPRALP